MSINFYVYINEPNDKAFIHHAECSFCNFGKGMVAEGHSSNGKWIGPFNTMREYRQRYPGKSMSGGADIVRTGLAFLLTMFESESYLYPISSSSWCGTVPLIP